MWYIYNMYVNIYIFLAIVDICHSLILKLMCRRRRKKEKRGERGEGKEGRREGKKEREK